MGSAAGGAAQAPGPGQGQTQGPTDDTASAPLTSRALAKAGELLLTRNGAIVVGSTLALLVGRVAYDVMESLIHLDFYTVAEVGFATGALMTATGVGAVSYARRLVNISPEAALRKSFDLVRSSPGVTDMMGSGVLSARLNTGVFRAYTSEGGRFGVTKSTGTVGWIPPTIALAYQIYGGADRQAVVSVGAHTDAWGRLIVDFAAVDLLAPNTDVPAKTVIVIGDESKFHIRDELRTYVSLNRRYVGTLPQKAFPSKLA